MTALVKATREKNYLNEARKVFRKNYEKSHFVLRGPFVENNNEIGIEEQKKIIYVQHFDMIKYIFETFGDLMHMIRVSFENIDVTHGKEIVKKIAENCSNSLEALTLENCKGNVLDDLTITFPYVFTLKFSSSSTDRLEVNADHLKLNEMFTGLYALHLGHTTATDWQFIGDKWPHLEVFNVLLKNEKDQNRADTSHVIHFLNNNPKIKHLAVHHSNLNILKMASEILPQLDYLSIVNLSEDYWNYDGEPIRFDGVRGLMVEIDNENQTPERIVCNHLDSLILKTKHAFTDKWTEFLTHQVNPNLSHFVVDAGELSREQFLILADKLPDLQAIEVVSPSKLMADDIAAFIGNSESLKNFNARIQMDGHEQRRLSDVLPLEWNIEQLMPIENKVKISLKW